MVRFSVLPDFSPPPCLSLVAWSSETFFHNSTDAVQAVQFLGVSNGSAGPNPKPLVIQPHQTVMIGGNESLLGWEPVPGTILWVNRLDVPPGVIVANRVATHVFDVSADTSGITCRAVTTDYAGLPLPVFGALIPAGTAQYFLGTDVGTFPAGQQVTDSRLNVGVYNSGTADATATVKVYCGHIGAGTATPNSLVLTDEIQVPANAVVQKAVVGSTIAAARAGGWRKARSLAGSSDDTDDMASGASATAAGCATPAPGSGGAQGRGSRLTYRTRPRGAVLNGVGSPIRGFGRI